MKHYYDTVADQNNVLVPGATVSVFSAFANTVLASDSFNRANSNPIGPPWQGPAQLLNNSMVLGSLSGTEYMLYTGITWPNDQFTRATIGQLVHNAGYLALVLRGDTAGQNFYYIDLDASGISGGVGGIGIGTPLNLQKILGGVFVGPIAQLGFVIPQIGDVFTAQVVGTTISVFQNGTLFASFTDTNSPILSGSAGLLLESGSNTTAVTQIAWDNWSGGSVAPARSLATIYSDNGITPKPNPTSTDADGRFDFYVADGVYDIQVSGANISTFTQSSVEISDVTEASAQDAPWQTELLNLADQASTVTPPAGFMSLYTKASPKHLFVKDDAGNETDLFTSVGAGAQPPLNSFQYNNTGGLGGSQFLYNPDDSSNLICQAPCVTLTASGQSSGIQLISPSNNNSVTISVQDGVFGGGLTVETQVTSPGANTLGQGSISFIGGNTQGGSCFQSIPTAGTPPCAQAYVAQPGDIGTETTNGQDIVGFSAQPLLNKSASFNVGTLAGFAVNTPVQQDALGGFVPAVEGTVNSYGLRVMDLGGLSSTDSAAIRIESQTNPRSGTKFAIESLAGAGISLLNDGIQVNQVDLQSEVNPGNPSTGRIRLYGDSGTGNLTCLTPTGGNCLPGGGSTGSVTSVGLSLPPEFVVSGSPVTTAGTLTGTLAQEYPNTVFAGPTQNDIGGIFDGNTTAISGPAPFISLQRTPSTNNEIAFVLASSDHNVTQTSGIAISGSGTWTRQFANGNTDALFSQVLTSNVQLTATVSAGASTSWAAEMFMLALPSSTAPIIVQSANLSGAVNSPSTVTFPNNTVVGNSILVVLMGAPSNPSTVNAIIVDSQGNNYTPIGIAQNSVGSGECAAAWLSSNIVGATRDAVTFATGPGVPGVSGALVAFEVSNLGNSTGQPTFRKLTNADMPANAGTPIKQFTNSTLIGNVSVGTAATNIAQNIIAFPSTGGPWRVFISYSLYLAFPNTNNAAAAFWVSDGSSTFAGLQTGQSNASTGGRTSASYAGYSTVTYTSNSTVTFTLRGQYASSSSFNVEAAPQVGSGPNSSFQVAVMASN